MKSMSPYNLTFENKSPKLKFKYMQFYSENWSHVDEFYFYHMRLFTYPELWLIPVKLCKSVFMQRKGKIILLLYDLIFLDFFSSKNF